MFPKFKRGKEPTTSMTGIFLHPRQFRLKGSLLAAKAPRAGCWQRFPEKSSRWPLGSVEVSQGFPGASLGRVSRSLWAHNLQGPNQVRPPLRVLKPGVCVSCVPQKTMVSHTQEKPTSPESARLLCGITMTHLSQAKP